MSNLRYNWDRYNHLEVGDIYCRVYDSWKVSDTPFHYQLTTTWNGYKVSFTREGFDTQEKAKEDCEKSLTVVRQLLKGL